MQQNESVRSRVRVEISQKSRIPDFAADVLRGLSAFPKRLYPMYFYDAKGSELFERICRLPEYYLTRTEREILAGCARAIAGFSDGSMRLVEFGSGNSEKTRLLIEALLERQNGLCYTPIDISHSAVTESAHRLAFDYPGLTVEAQAAEYGMGLSRIRGQESGQKLIVFLGSNLGNFDPVHGLDFLDGIRRAMSNQDYLLIGNDLAKDVSVMLPAYNDSEGVTAAFNKNLLYRINRELGGDFDPSLFQHQALYDSSRGRIEMHLRADRAQTVSIASLRTSFKFAEGETIHTESSYKYPVEALDSMFNSAGLRVVQRWSDERRWFAVTLLNRIG